MRTNHTNNPITDEIKEGDIRLNIISAPDYSLDSSLQECRQIQESETRDEKSLIMDKHRRHHNETAPGIELCGSKLEKETESPSPFPDTPSDFENMQKYEKKNSGNYTNITKKRTLTETKFYSTR